jgi:hypothetical protein
MTTVFEGETFARRTRYVLPNVLHDVELHRCTFRQCQAPAQTSVGERPTIRNVLLDRCHIEASDLGPVIVEDCAIDTIWLHRGNWGPQRLTGCAFRHVTIRGNVNGALQLDYARRRNLATYALDDEFVVANAEYYASVDWALDIREARFESCWLHFSDVPARLIRRDPATQIVVTRDRAIASRWRELDLPEGAWRLSIEDFLATELPDLVLVACPRGTRYERQMATIDVLRAEGIAEPD